MKFKKTDYFVIAVAVILVVIVVIIVSILLTPPAQKPEPSSNTTQEQTQLEPEDTSPLPPVNYDPEGQNTIINKVINRETPLPDDLLAKNKILATLPSGKTSGTVYQSTNVSIYYTADVDIFQVEILTTDLDNAEKEGNNWFLSQGYSQIGICNAPVQFYLNPMVAEQLRDKDVTFNPVGPGCR